MDMTHEQLREWMNDERPNAVYAPSPQDVQAAVRGLFATIHAERTYRQRVEERLEEWHLMREDRDTLLAENRRLRTALAETEALEMQHGAVIARLTAERDEARQALREYEHYVMEGRDEQHQRLVAERDEARGKLEKLADNFDALADSANDAMDYEPGAIWDETGERLRALLAVSKGEDDA